MSDAEALLREAIEIIRGSLAWFEDCHKVTPWEGESPGRCTDGFVEEAVLDEMRAFLAKKSQNRSQNGTAES